MMDFKVVSQRRRTQLIVILAVIALLIYLFWPSVSIDDTSYWRVSPYRLVHEEPTVIEVLDSRFGRLPYKGSPTIPYQRPAKTMPEYRDVFPEATLFVNDVRVDPSKEIRFKSGENVHMQIRSKRTSNDIIPSNYRLDVDILGLACAAQNHEGWMIVEDHVLTAQDGKQERIAQGYWTVPDRRGQFFLTIQGSIFTGMYEDNIPIWMARAIPLTIE